MGKFATQKLKKRQFCANRHTKRSRVEYEGEGEPVMQENNEESEVSLSADEGNVALFQLEFQCPTGSFSLVFGRIPVRKEPLNLQQKVLKALMDSGFVIWNLLEMFFPYLSASQNVYNTMEENSIKRKDCASKLHLTCQHCKWMHLSWISKRKTKEF
ncbi:Hypothetical predicted protein [Paramuricea clavata]|uniref:Uncharacterized protein n=1 Tax=Paramuricea clavata TaxID=317549 RepID=A0A7D9IFQ7_PARCT|nr:Hypothetical predicted protein [Paramuricea clavata]